MLLSNFIFLLYKHEKKKCSNVNDFYQVHFLPSSQDTNINMERAFDQLLQLARTKKGI